MYQAPLSSVPLGSTFDASRTGQTIMNQTSSTNRMRDTYNLDRARTAELPGVTSAYTRTITSAPSSASPSSTSNVDSDSYRFKKFESTRTNALRPIVFQPNGSFRSLKENGKLAVESYESDVYKGRAKNELAQTDYHLPGYTGFVRGSQHISARTFGETTRRALVKEYREIVCESPIPSSPQANRKIRQEEIEDSFVKNMFGDKKYQVPGYTGFIPGVRSTYAKRYGAATSEQMSSHATKFPREDNQSNQFARTQLPRQHATISSAPLPGGAVSQAPPEFFIPDHVKYLKFFPM